MHLLNGESETEIFLSNMNAHSRKSKKTVRLSILATACQKYVPREFHLLAMKKNITKCLYSQENCFLNQKSKKGNTKNKTAYIHMHVHGVAMKLPQ
jgi:hypothetical protein